MTRHLLVAALLLGLCTTTEAQNRWDFGVHVGAANYLGDIGGKDGPRRDFISDIKIDQSQYAVGAHIRYQASRSWALTTMFMSGQVKGDDVNTTEYAPRQVRNLKFRNNLYELSVRAEFLLFADNDLTNRGYYNPDFKLFGFVGAAGIKHNPQGYLREGIPGFEEGWYDLRELRTEAQETEYGEFTLAFPMGIGLYLTYDRKWRIGWEAGYRLTSTDYLDDISTVYAREEDLSSPLAIALANQTTVDVAEAAGEAPGFIYNYHYLPGTASTAANLRGVKSNNDGYVFSTFSFAMLLQKQSGFSRSRHKWLNGRKKRRKARAKF